MFNSEIVRFILVGIVNTIFYYIIYVLLIYLDFTYSLSVVVATMVGILFSFKTFSKLVFNSSNNKLIYKFIGVYIFNTILNIFIIKLYIYWYNDNLYLAGLIATLIVSVNSFILNKFYVFKEKNG